MVPPFGFGGIEFVDEPNSAKAVMVTPWELYEVYGDTTAMSENYDAMVKWLDYEAADKASHGGNIPGLGDWESAQSTTAQAIIDYGYYDAVKPMAKVAQVLGRPATRPSIRRSRRASRPNTTRSTCTPTAPATPGTRTTPRHPTRSPSTPASYRPVPPGGGQQPGGRRPRVQ